MSQNFLNYSFQGDSNSLDVPFDCVYSSDCTSTAETRELITGEPELIYATYLKSLEPRP